MLSPLTLRQQATAIGMAMLSGFRLRDGLLRDRGGRPVMTRHTNDRPVVSDMLVGICAAALSGCLVGLMIGASIMWLAAGGS